MQKVSTLSVSCFRHTRHIPSKLPDISIVQFMVETHEKNSLSGENYPDMVSAYKLSSGQVRTDFDKFWNGEKKAIQIVKTFLSVSA